MAIDIPKNTQAEETAHDAASHPLGQKLARLGFFAKGVVYSLIGLLALQAALGRGGETTSQEGALKAIIEQPFGKALLAIVGVGLIGYALWRFAAGAFNLLDKDDDAKGIILRIAYVFIAFSYATLAWTALRLVLGSGGDTGDSSQDWTRTVMELPFGRWLVVLAGLIMAIVAGYQLYRAYSTNFTKHLDLGGLSPELRTSAIWLGRIGMAARGVVFGIIAFLLAAAGLNHNPEEAQGLGGALQTLAEQPYGRLLMGIVAAGLIAYGLYTFVEARFRRIQG